MECIYTSEALVVCVKPAGILSQDDGRGTSLPARLRAELGGEIYPVHRLDRMVGGLMVCARTAGAAAFLSRRFRKAGWLRHTLRRCGAARRSRRDG